MCGYYRHVDHRCAPQFSCPRANEYCGFADGSRFTGINHPVSGPVNQVGHEPWLRLAKQELPSGDRRDTPRGSPVRQPRKVLQPRPRVTSEAPPLAVTCSRGQLDQLGPMIWLF